MNITRSEMQFITDKVIQINETISAMCARVTADPDPIAVALALVRSFPQDGQTIVDANKAIGNVILAIRDREEAA